MVGKGHELLSEERLYTLDRRSPAAGHVLYEEGQRRAARTERSAGSHSEGGRMPALRHRGTNHPETCRSSRSEIEVVFLSSPKVAMMDRVRQRPGAAGGGFLGGTIVPDYRARSRKIIGK